MPDDPQPTNTNAELFQAVQALLGNRPIAYHAALAKALSSATAGIFLSQLLYWSPRTKNEEGWVWKTQEQVYDETALTRREQETARKILKEKQVIEERRAGVPARLFFRVNMEQLVRLLSGLVPETEISGAHELTAEEEIQYGAFRHSSMALPDTLESANRPDRFGAFRQSISENTTKNTPEINNSNIRKASPQVKRGLDDGKARQTTASRSKLRQISSSDVEEEDGRHNPRATTSLRAGGNLHPMRDMLPARRGRPTAAEAEARRAIRQYIEDYARELGDEAPKSSVTRAINLMREANVSVGTFIAAMQAAKKRTQQRSASIVKMAEGGKSPYPQKIKMPYFFSLLEEELGLKEPGSMSAATRP